MTKSYKATQFRVDRSDKSHTILSQIYCFFLTNHLAIVDLWDEFIKWYYESKNALNSPRLLHLAFILSGVQ
jgi:hypothetical protein